MQSYFKILYVLVFILSVGSIKGQCSYNNKPYHITCAYDICAGVGTITIDEDYDPEISAAYAVFDSNSIRYTLKLNGQAVAGPQREPFFGGLASGNYTVAMTADCADGSGAANIYPWDYNTISKPSDIRFGDLGAEPTGIVCGTGNTGKISFYLWIGYYLQHDSDIMSVLKVRLMKDGVQAGGLLPAVHYDTTTFENLAAGDYKMEVVYPCTDGSYVVLAESNTITVDGPALTADVTASTCAGNGIIQVEWPSGAMLPGDPAKTIYTLKHNGAIEAIQNSSLFQGLNPGTYTVEAQVTCEDGTKKFKSGNITVQGVNPGSMTATFSSRASYSCITGQIYIDMTGGYGDFSFEILSAPEGVATGPVAATKGAVTNGKTRYTFDDLYPAGTYTIKATDPCGNSPANFTGVISSLDFNSISASLSTPSGPSATSNCRVIELSLSRSHMTTACQFALTASAAAPAESEWINYFGRPQINTDLPEGTTIKDYYSSGIYIHLRANGKSSSGCTTRYIRKVITPFSFSYYRSPSDGGTCDNFDLRLVGERTDHCHACFPVDVQVVEIDNSGAQAGSAVYQGQWTYNTIYPGNVTTQNWLDINNLDRTKRYRVMATTGDGYSVTRIVEPQPLDENFISGEIVSSNNSMDKKCDGFISSFYLRTGCPITFKLYTVADDGTRTQVAHPLSGSPVSTVGSHSLGLLPYGVHYLYTLSRGTGVLEVDMGMMTNPFGNFEITEFTVSANSCAEQSGTFSYRLNGSASPGTRYRITNSMGTQVWDSNSSYMRNMSIPEDTYTLTVTDGCDPSIVKTRTLTVGKLYTAGTVSATTEPVCGGMKIKLSGSLLYNGQPVDTYCNVNGRIVKVTEGLEIPVYSGTQTDYPIHYGISSSYISYTCNIKTETVRYTAPAAITFKPDTEGIRFEGRKLCVNDTKKLYIGIQGGMAPYRYELLAGGNPVPVKSMNSNNTDVYFELEPAGIANAYTVRVTDACGGAATQTVNISDLIIPDLVSVSPSPACIGETVNLVCMNLPADVGYSYSWSGPAGFSSTLQNPQVYNITGAASGEYILTLIPDDPNYCMNPINDTVALDVYPEFEILTITSDHVACMPGARPLECTVSRTDLASLHYQWQESPDGVSGWTDIAGATGSNYLPANGRDRGLYYYRVKVESRCGNIHSNPVVVEVKPCNVLINPGLRYRRKVTD